MSAAVSPEERAVNPPTVLIVEDNPDSRDALRALLEAYGFRVIAAENGEQGVHQAVLSHPDIILMDIMMPVMDGLEATRRLRQTSGFESIPIVALTAMAGSKELAMGAGCSGYLTKPIDIPKFLQTIRALLGGNGGAFSEPRSAN